jgi:RNA-dependent RNA polymerase
MRRMGCQSRSEPIKGFPIAFPDEVAPFEDATSRIFTPVMQGTLNAPANGAENRQAGELRAHYAHEVQYLCMTHTLVDTPSVRLTKEEALGTTLANCLQPQCRTARSHCMRLHAEGVMRNICAQTYIVP